VQHGIDRIRMARGEETSTLGTLQMERSPGPQEP
jgi:hypothetical protein